MDSGATDSYINSELVQERSLPTTQLDTPINVTNFDGKTSSSGLVRYKCRTAINLEGHCIPKMDFLVLPLPDTPIVLGYDFQEQSGAIVDFLTRTVRLGSARTPGLSGVKLRLSATHPDIVPLPRWTPKWIDKIDYVPPDLAKC